MRATQTSDTHALGLSASQPRVDVDLPSEKRHFAVSMKAKQLLLPASFFSLSSIPPPQQTEHRLLSEKLSVAGTSAYHPHLCAPSPTMR